jgi:hypothetical protein
VLISIFHLSPAVLQATPLLAARLRYMGVTHLEAPTHISRDDISYTKDQGFRLIGIGDDLIRTPDCWARNGTEAIISGHATKLRESGICDGVEMVDEVKQLPHEYPIVPFLIWWREAGGPPIAWPGKQPQKFENMRGLSDYISRQWNWETCRRGQDRLDRLAGSLSGLKNETRPICAMIDISAERYCKLVEGDHFQPGKDRLEPVGEHRRPPSPLNIAKQLKLARELGATRARLWGWDAPWWPEWRAGARKQSILMTGMSMMDERWADFELAVKGILK